MNVVERTQEANRSNVLPPPLRLEVGSIILIRMQGHTHSPGGLEYFAPAVVLAQYPDQYGSIDALVWDSSAGNHFAHGYHVRELAARGDGPEREMYELQSNIGGILFSPEQFSNMAVEIDILSSELRQKHQVIKDLVARVQALEAVGATPRATDTSSSKPATVTPEVEPKAQPKK